MKKINVVLAAMAILSVTSLGTISRASEVADQVDVTTDPSLDYGSLEAMAKGAIIQEAAALNDVVAKLGLRIPSNNEPRLLEGYKNSDLQIFPRFGKTEGIDPALLNQTCILSVKSVQALTAKQFTADNLSIVGNLNAVNATRAAINGKFFGVVESACLNAKRRFSARLAAATSKGQPISQLTPTAVKNITDVVFFPADYAKPTKFKKLEGVLPYLINGAFIVGGAASIVGWPATGIWMSITIMSGSGFTIKTLLPGPDELIQQETIKVFTVKNGVPLDLTPQEQSLDELNK